MSDSEAELGVFVDQAAAVIWLKIDPAHRPGIIANFARIKDLARLFLDFEVPDRLDPAPVYEP